MNEMPKCFRGNQNSLSIVRLSLLFSLLVLPVHSSPSNNNAPPSNRTSESTKRVDEEEEEIGYIQTLLLNTPAIATRNSTYQKIEVYASDHFGKVFLLDDCLQLTERDAPHYNEMLAHVPVMEYLSSAAANEAKEPLEILVLGGGDGYVVSELLKYPNIGSIDHVDLDGEVINVSKDHFPWAKSVWDNEKVNLVVGDGSQFVKDQVEKGKNYHVIIQDASDPFWIRYDGSVVILPSHVLYEEDHFRRMYTLLEAKNGVLMYQAETYNIPSNLKEISKWRKVLANIGFWRVRYGTIATSTYPTGQIGFFVSHAGVSNGESVCNSLDGASTKSCTGLDALGNPDISLDWMDWNKLATAFSSLNGSTQYYHPRIHRR
jgi:spermidine synthase